MTHTHLIAQTRSGTYEVWSWMPDSHHHLMRRVTEGHAAKLTSGSKLTTVGDYVLIYTPPTSVTLGKTAYVDYTLLRFDPSQHDPLAGNIQQSGSWYWDKFAGGYSYARVPGGPQSTDLELVGVTGYVLSLLPTPGRMTYGLWGFDAYVDAPGGSQDPIATSLSNADALPWLEAGDELFPFGNQVLVVNRQAGCWTRYSFDPQRPNPLSYPPLASGTVSLRPETHLVAVGLDLLAWAPGEPSCVLYHDDPADPFGRSSTRMLPEDFPEDVVCLTPVVSKVPIDPRRAATPGTMDFLRTRVKHVVVYVLESRSFDSVVGWLHEHSSEGIHWVGATAGPPFEGASDHHENRDAAGVVHHQHKVAHGGVGPTVSLVCPRVDPFHGTPDAIRQQWSRGYPSYAAGERADMGGFVLNDASAEVMAGFTPTQLGVFHGLASAYALSDMWFCSEAGGTTTNRATLASGSAYNLTSTYEGGNAYASFSKTPHRQSMWKVLANHGILDWAIYYSVLWEGAPYTYNLFLEGELPSVDKSWQRYVQPIQSFFQVAARGDLPAFSFLEPVWVDPSGMFTSYHPGGDMLPGEQGLQNIYEALRTSPCWDETVLVVSFSKGGGMYDHVPAHPMKRAWPNDGVDGYGFDTTGTRVPTLVISPLVEPNTVFRSDDPSTPYDATSIAATVLSWFGIPKERWGLGERVAAAPTFEGVLTLETPRTDTPTLARATDANYPTTAPIVVAAPAPVSATWKASPPCGAFTDTACWEGGVLPTDVATFEASDVGEVRFAYDDPQQVSEVRFGESAGSYTLLFDQAAPETPTLTLAGDGVINHSRQSQRFRVAATSLATTDVQLAFANEASAGDATITYETAPATPQAQSGGIVAFHQRTRAGSANFVVRTGALPPGPYSTVGSEVRFLDRSTADAATFTVWGSTGPDSDTFGNVVFYDEATAGLAHFTNVGGTVGDGGNTQFYGNTSADRCQIENLGGTGAHGNGGDTAFDGRATAGQAVITNAAAQAGYGGVTSFNNNAPYMAAGFGATAGNATLKNLGAERAPSGGGGHTEFTGKYGAGDAGTAVIENCGTKTANSTGAGYTLFATTGNWPYYQPTAARATIHNFAGSCAGAQAGYTRFAYVNYDRKQDDGKPGPLGGDAVIRNYGGREAGAPGGYTLFQNHARAERATLVAEGGTHGGQSGSVRFTDSADGDDATVILRGGGLEVDGSTLASVKVGSLSCESVDDAECTLTFKVGTKQAFVAVGRTLILPTTGQVYVKFVEGDPPSSTPQVLLTSTQLHACDAAKFYGSPVSGKSPSFSVVGHQLAVQFS